MSLLPTSGSAVDSTQEGELQILGVESAETEAVFDALGSDTARSLLHAIHEEPSTPSKLADRIGTSVQNVLYHLKKLEEADLIRVADTQYSEKGTEMKVYAPADNPTVVFVGTDDRKRSFRQLVKRLLGAVSVLLLSSILFQVWFKGVPFGAQPGGASLEPEPVFPPGLAFFLGGAVLLLVLMVSWYWNSHLATVQRRVRGSSILSGRNLKTTKRALTTAVGLFVVTGSFWLLRALLNLDTARLGPFDIIQHGLLLLGILAAVNAYWNDGLIVSWALVCLPIAGLSFYGLGMAVTSGDLSVIAGSFMFGVLGGIVGAAILGTGGFLVGVGAQRVVGLVRHLVYPKAS